MAGVNFPWKYKAGYLIHIHTFRPLTQLFGEKAGKALLGK